MRLTTRILVTVFLLALSAMTAPAGEITIVASGDILLGGSAAQTLERHGFEHAFAATRDILCAADIALGNLEAPLTNSLDEYTDKRFRFKVNPEAVEALANAGFDLLTLANNHMGDYGHQGVLDTIAILNDAGLKSAGAGSNLQHAREAAIFDIDGTRVALLAYSNTFPKEFYATAERPGTAPGYPGYFIPDIRKARANADIVVASFHWGGEAMSSPKDYQQRLARQAIDAGAQVVLGHHPHVLQGVEFYRGGVIYYSLGNFAFGSYSKTARTSSLARVTFDGEALTRAEVLPLNVYNLEVAFQPRPLTGDSASSFARHFNELCAPFDTALEPQGGPFWVVRPSSPSPP